MIEATGRVVLAETGEPIVGLGVALSEGGNTFGRYIVDTDRTDADGAFTVSYTPGERVQGAYLNINDEPYDSRYTTAGENLLRGGRRDLGTVELERNESQ